MKYICVIAMHYYLIIILIKRRGKCNVIEYICDRLYDRGIKYVQEIIKYKKNKLDVSPNFFIDYKD